jgi:acyl-CoA reductase-like NAD-dependent aldehyde dehydrogenase
MQRFFFHINFTGKFITDPEGVEFADLDAARNSALRAVRELAADSLAARAKFTLRSARICSEKGEVLAEIFVPEAIREMIPADLL